jgi:hypothetical protein
LELKNKSSVNLINLIYLLEFFLGRMFYITKLGREKQKQKKKARRQHEHEEKAQC